jgi:TRAP-type mannitol/chloroaromatic compound transport system permease small subunit
MAESFCRAIDSINEWAGKCVSILALPMALFIGIEVVARYVFNRPTIWVWDVNIQLLGALVLFGAGYTLLHGGHIIVDVIVIRFSRRTRAITDMITSVFFFFAIGVLVWKAAMAGWDSLLSRELFTSYWNPPIYPLKISVSIGAFLLLLQGVAKFIRDLSIAIHPESGAAP